MKTYQTAEVAKLIGIHPNTVRLYEEWGLIPKPERRENGYRVFTEFHIQQIRLARTAYQVEILQNGLRKQITRMVKLSAAGKFDEAIALTESYLQQLRRERLHAQEAIEIAQQILSGKTQKNITAMKRKEASEYLGVSIDALRNWEMNGLLEVKRKQNGYRIYTDDDIRRLKIIRSLRCANYSLAAILRMLGQVSKNPKADIEAALNTPQPSDTIISSCDRLIVSLDQAEKNALLLLEMLHNMKNQFS
ncbi:MAG: MerR family transcriptional regulator [Oscillospiraceae bacterium]